MTATLGDTAPLHAIIKRLAVHFKNVTRRASKMLTGMDDPQQQQLWRTLLMCTRVMMEDRARLFKTNDVVS